MTDNIMMEAKKHALSQLQYGLIKLTRSCHPQDADMAARLLAAPMGRIYQIVLVDQESIQPVDEPKDTLTQQAAIMSNEPASWSGLTALDKGLLKMAAKQ